MDSQRPAAALLRWLDAALAGIAAAGKWLAVPVLLLLFLQWPLRDLVKAWSREANDLGQVLFALFVAIAVTAATRANAHLFSDVLAGRYSRRVQRRIAALGALLVLVPWSLFVIVATWPTAGRSLAVLERFADTGNPGYFVIKCAALLLAVLMLLQAIVDILRRRD